MFIYVLLFLNKIYLFIFVVVSNPRSARINITHPVLAHTTKPVVGMTRDINGVDCPVVKRR